VGASPERTLQAVRELRARDAPLVLGLTALRRLPARAMALFKRGDRVPRRSTPPPARHAHRGVPLRAV